MVLENDRPIILIRGAGEQATGVGWVLAKVGFRVLMTEVEQPLMVRWPVSFGTAVLEGRWQVEGIWAQKISSPRECPEIWTRGEVPVLVDPNLANLTAVKPGVLIDAILAKYNTGTQRNMAPLVIGLGPGFSAGIDVDLVIETNRGHDLGRVIYSGEAEPNTGVPGEIGGYSDKRVLYAGLDGRFMACRNIGEEVKPGDLVGKITGNGYESEITAKIPGVLRGLIRDGTRVKAKMKIGDVDPRYCGDFCWTISDKARSLGGAALMAIMENTQRAASSLAECKKY